MTEQPKSILSHIRMIRLTILCHVTVPDHQVCLSMTSNCSIYIFRTGLVHRSTTHSPSCSALYSLRIRSQADFTSILLTADLDTLPPYIHSITMASSSVPQPTNSQIISDPAAQAASGQTLQENPADTNKRTCDGLGTSGFFAKG